MNWQITQFDDTPPSLHVLVTDTDTGSTIDLNVTEGPGNSYTASGTVTYKLTQAQRNILNDKLIPGIQAANTTLNLPVPGSLGPNDDLVFNFQNVSADWSNGTLAGVASAVLGSIESTLNVDANQGSIQVRGGSNAVFMYQGANVYTSVQSASAFRSPVTGLIEHSYVGVDAGGAPRGGSSQEVFCRPPFGRNINWSNELRFDGDVSLRSPVTAGDLPNVLYVGDAITASIEGGFAMAFAAVDIPKYQCVKNILQMFGACLLCTLGILASIGGGPPGIVTATILCFGAKAWTIIDLIMCHLGLWS